MSTKPRSTFLGARITTDTYVQLKTLSKITGKPVSKLASDIISNHLRTKG